MYKDILVSVDLADTGHRDQTIQTAVALCRQFGATLHALFVVPDVGMTFVANYFPDDYEDVAKREASRQLHAFIAAHVPKEVPVQHIVGHGTVYEEILECAERIKADLIILGAHRPALRDYLLGPNAARVVRHARQSVLVVR